MNGDGKSDTLWQNNGGQMVQWLSTGSSFESGLFHAAVNSDWHAII